MSAQARAPLPSRSGLPAASTAATVQLCRAPQAEAHARKLLTTTNLSAVLRPQHVVTIKDSASVDQTLRVSRASGPCCRRRTAALPCRMPHHARLRCCCCCFACCRAAALRCHTLALLPDRSQRSRRALPCLPLASPLPPGFRRRRCWRHTASCLRQWWLATAAMQAQQGSKWTRRRRWVGRAAFCCCFFAVGEAVEAVGPGCACVLAGRACFFSIWSVMFACCA